MYESALFDQVENGFFRYSTTIDWSVPHYEKMLDEAYTQLPESVFEKHRFEIPKVVGHLQGNRTIISNFNQIASHLRRPVAHLLKYLLKELATPGAIRNGQLIVGTKIPASRFNEKIKKYAKKPILVATIGSKYTNLRREELEKANIITFAYPSVAARAVKALADYAEFIRIHG